MTDWNAVAREASEATRRRLEAERLKNPKRVPHRPVWNPAAEILPERQA